MAIALVGSVKGNGNDNYTTGSMDTTGATLLVATFGDALASAPTITDTYTNTWVQARRYRPFSVASSIYYAWNPTVGTGHSFTFTGTDQFGSAQVRAYSGAQTSSNPLDQSNNNHALSSLTVQPGSVTPTTDGQLVVVHDQFDVLASMPTINGGFDSPTYGDIGQGAVYLGSGTSYLIQTTATAANPTFTAPSTQHQYATIATFKADAGPPTLVVPDAALAVNADNVVLSVPVELRGITQSGLRLG